MRSHAPYFILGAMSLMLVAIFALAIQTDTQTNSTDMPEVLPTVDPFPRPTDYDIIVAEQVFENGRMFYIQMAGRIWVMINGEDHTTGTWAAYEDSWDDTMPEVDSALASPDGLIQPGRGFGKLWRDNPDIREALGWALDPEYGHISHYTFEPGAEVETEDGEIVRLPGIHTLTSWYGGIVYIFDEAEGTWLLDPDSIPTPEPESTETPESTADAGA